jgi:glycosyltransferase involved in cell wall biosynthesis
LRPIAFDVTHLASRLPVRQPSGIDKVDLAYASHFAHNPCQTAVHYGVWRPRFHDGQAIAALYDLASQTRWMGGGADPVFERICAHLTGKPGSPQAPQASHDASRRRLGQIGWRLAQGTVPLPHHTLYLNVAQHAYEFPRFFTWLNQRRDVCPVFFVHDLLSLDYPEYFRPGNEAVFRRRFDTIQRYAGAIITTSRAVAERTTQEFARVGRPPVPIHVEPLPSALPVIAGSAHDPALAAVPYFVILGTIEPRKNHLLLLNIWRRLAQDYADAPQRIPKLVIVGGRGWENEQVLDVLDRSTLVRPHVIEAAGLGDAGLVRLLANARGLLMPSFAEGYGIPVVEALTLGTPVVASDIPVFREIAQDQAIYCHPLDGPGWRRAIEMLSQIDSPDTTEVRRRASAFAAPTWHGYFAGINRFLDTL